MEALVKRNGSVPLTSTGFLPTTNTFFEDFLSRDLMEMTGQNFATLGTNLPSVNLRETDKKIEIELAAPGLKKEDFKIELDNKMLTISSEKEETRKSENYYRKEFSYQSFSRSFNLPDYSDENHINANYKDGILHVDIAKKEGGKKKTAKNIAIK